MSNNDDLADFGNSLFSIGENTTEKNKVKLRTMLDGGSSEFNGKNPAYYRNKFNKILDKLVCKDSNGKWMTKTDDPGEFVMGDNTDGPGNTCSYTLAAKLFASRGENSLREADRAIIAVTNELNELKRELLGDSGGIPGQAISYKNLKNMVVLN